MEYEFTDGRLYVKRTPEERQPLLRRLRRIEGQVRGLQQMLEQDRYCLDELQQAHAVMAALREVVLLISTQHLEASVTCAARDANGTEVLEEARRIMRSAMRRT